METPFKHKTKTVSLTPEHEHYIEENNLSITDITREAIDQKINTNNKTKKKKKVNYYTSQIITLGIGICILAFAATPRNFISWLAMFSIGLFFVVYALFNTVMEVYYARRG